MYVMSSSSNRSMPTACRCSGRQTAQALHPPLVFSTAWYDARRGRVARWSSTATIAFGLLAFASPSWAQGARIPADAVDTFHAALKKKDTAAALSLLDRGLVVFEFGVVDPTVEAYAFRHLPFDIDVAAVSDWRVESRRVGGEGDERWVLNGRCRNA